MCENFELLWAFLLAIIYEHIIRGFFFASWHVGVKWPKVLGKIQIMCNLIAITEVTALDQQAAQAWQIEQGGQPVLDKKCPTCPWMGLK